MRLRKFSIWFSAVVIFAIVANALFLLMIQQGYDSMVSAQQHRQRALVLADELRQETNYLTNLVRGYTSTGQTRYLTYYYDILAIRQGEKPQPVNYVPGVYWEMVIAGEIQHQFQPNDTPISLKERMKSLGFSQIELDALSKVSTATEAMKQIEQIAFAATQGLYDPVSKDFVSDGEPNLDFAIQMVHSLEYNQLNSNLAKAVTALSNMVDKRTNSIVAIAKKDLERWISLTLGSMLLTFVMVVMVSQVIRSMVLRPIEKLSRAAIQLAGGDYSARTGAYKRMEATDALDSHQPPVHAVEELVKLSTTFDGMAMSIEKDIAQRKASASEIKKLAFYDPLTSLPNRRFLLDSLRQGTASSARTGRGGALLFLDLDNFKSLNDTLGHDIGDMLLQQTAQRITSCVREDDTVARLGGDEFVVMLRDLNEIPVEAATKAEVIAEKILIALAKPYQLSLHTAHITCSIGITMFNGHEHPIDELMKQADIAMYQAKKAGRNTLRFYDPQMQASITARVTMEAELRIALKNNQFQLYYQPQVNSARKIQGVEALIRWIHPERGTVSPAEFIPLAEENGLILPIGLWVLKAACAQLQTWQQDALTEGLSIAVNVSAKQFHQAKFVAQLSDLIQHYDINPRRLKLELTESMLLEDIESIIASMNALSDIGILFSLDDFGTGYSSLQYLKRLPLHQLKIDQSFVRDISVDNSDRAIVRTIIAMAHILNLDVLAEGVETEEQRQLLMEKGCAQFQGYLFNKPVPIDELEVLLKQP